MYRAFKENLLENRKESSMAEDSKLSDTAEYVSIKEEFMDPSNMDDKVAEKEDDLQVANEIKQYWEKEQLALKERLICEDVSEWEKLRVTPENLADHPGVVPLEYLGGVDISFVKGDNVNACAAFTVVQLPSLELVYEDYRMVELTAPYIPGFLAFREVGFLVDMFRTLQEKSPELTPQVILCDGNGILHPREFGIACHLGVLIGVPTIGAAKKLFQVDGLENDVEHKEKISKLEKGRDCFPLKGNSGRILGVALRSNDAAPNPIYVSPGHMISLETAVWVAQQCCKHRVPEPVRQADIGSRKYLRENFKEEEKNS